MAISKNLTVEQWALQWERRAAAGKSAKEKESIHNALHNHILPYIGNMQLNEVSYSDTSDIMEIISECSYSLRSKVLRTMRNLFNAARYEKLIDENPCYDLKAGKDDTQERVALTPEQQTRLEEAVHGTRSEAFVLIGLYTGLRRSEILALQWDCVHLDADIPYLTVSRALRWSHNQPKVSRILKSKAAFRSIPLPKGLVDFLRELSISQTGAYLVGGSQPLTESQFKNLWQIIKRRTTFDPTKLGTKVPRHNTTLSLDFQVTSHQLRHTYITRLVMGGANIKHVQYLAGHSSPMVTLKIYTHLVENSPEELAKSVTKVF